MHVLFANAVPSPAYTISAFLSCVVVAYFFRRFCSFQRVRHFVAVGLVVSVLILLHLAWIMIGDGRVLLIEATAIVIPVGSIGAVLGFCLGSFAYKKLLDDE